MSALRTRILSRAEVEARRLRGRTIIAALRSVRSGSLAYAQPPAPRRPYRGSGGTPKTTTEALLGALRAHRGNQTAAAAVLGVTRGSVWMRLRVLRTRGTLPSDVAAMVDARSPRARA